ncbi:MAG: L-fucose isomerase [Acholeplasmataceae bacterium]
MNRLNKRLPKVGVRPTIDGRREGIRESLEEKTVALAKAVKELIETEVRHASGESVEVIVNPETIGGVAEAARCEEYFLQAGVDVSLTVTPAWCYGTETIDMNPSRPKAIWGFNGSESPGAVYLAAATSAYAQLGLPVYAIYGRDVQDLADDSVPEDVKEKILRFVRAAIAKETMRDTSYLSIGSVSMGIAGSIIDPLLFSEYLGMRNEYVDMSEVMRRLELEIFDPDEYRKALAWVQKNCRIGADRNRKDLRFDEDKVKSDFATMTKMTLIIRDLMVGNAKLRDLGYAEEAEGHNAIASGFQGQRAWTDFMVNGDFSETILNSSFDWNGIREPFVVATENDALNAIPMLFEHLLTGQAAIFSDVRTFWSPEAVKRVTGHALEGRAKDGIIHLINSGSTTLDGTGRMSDESGQPVMKPFWKVTKEEVQACLENTRFCPANREYFRGGGFSTDFLTRGGMPVTMARINLVQGLGPVLQIAEGHTVDLPEKVHDALDQRTDPTWPTTWFVPILTGKGAFRSVYDLMNNWGSNHGAITYGHIGADLITLASMLRIPVALHNVSAERIFRPKAWSLFGEEGDTAADYRACDTYGPSYR